MGGGKRGSRRSIIESFGGHCSAESIRRVGPRQSLPFASIRRVKLTPPAPAPRAGTAWAVGDVCLFHVRGGRLIKTFPVERSSDFGYTPPLYQSKSLLPIPRALVLRGELHPRRPAPLRH